MVQLLLDVLGRDHLPQHDSATGAKCITGPAQERIECYHVDCRLSDSAEDIGRVRWVKLLRLLRYCVEAVWCRFRYGARIFLYVPAPGMRSAVYRDWLIMILCRPFFSRRIYYWQAAGLADWLDTDAQPWERWLTERLLGRPHMGIALGEVARRDPECLQTRRIEIVPNAIPDPCPDFDREVLPVRQVRASDRLSALKGLTTECRNISFHVLYLSLCLREKGLFDTVEAVALANSRLAQDSSPVRVCLDVAGKFWYEGERLEFIERIRRPDLNGTTGATTIIYHGFVSGEEKNRLFLEADCFCFPTYYWAESFPLALLEAMAWGLPIISTKWRSIPEMLPAGHGEVVDSKSPNQIAVAILSLLARGYDPVLRGTYLQRYTAERYTDNLRKALGLLAGNAAPLPREKAVGRTP